MQACLTHAATAGAPLYGRGERVVITDLKNRGDLNQEHARVVEWCGDDGRYKVVTCMRIQKEVLAVRPKNLRPCTRRRPFTFPFRVEAVECCMCDAPEFEGTRGQ